MSGCLFYVATWLVSSLVPFECPWRQSKGTSAAIMLDFFISAVLVPLEAVEGH